MKRIDVKAGMIVVYAHRGPRSPEESLLRVDGFGVNGYCGVVGIGSNHYSGNKRPSTFEREATSEEIEKAFKGAE